MLGAMLLGNGYRGHSYHLVIYQPQKQWGTKHYSKDFCGSAQRLVRGHSEARVHTHTCKYMYLCQTGQHQLSLRLTSKRGQSSDSSDSSGELLHLFSDYDLQTTGRREEWRSGGG